MVLLKSMKNTLTLVISAEETDKQYGYSTILKYIKIIMMIILASDFYAKFLDYAFYLFSQFIL